MIVPEWYISVHKVEHLVKRRIMNRKWTLDTSTIGAIENLFSFPSGILNDRSDAKNSSMLTVIVLVYLGAFLFGDCVGFFVSGIFSMC